VLQWKTQMKSKTAIFALFYLLGINTCFLWERLPYGLDLILTFGFAFLGLVLLFAFLVRLGQTVFNKFRIKKYNISTLIIAAVIAFNILFPFGVIRGHDLDPETFIKASREGAANCTTNLILGMDNSFIERSVCFGVDRNAGSYRISDDTVYLTFNNESNFGVKKTFAILRLKEDSTKGDYGYLDYYKSSNDTIPMGLGIRELKKKKTKAQQKR